MLISVLKYAEDTKNESLLQVYVVPLFYFPLLVIMSLILIVKLRAHRKKIEFDRKMNNPVERAKLAHENWKKHFITGYPQSHVFPKYIVKLASNYYQRIGAPKKPQEVFTTVDHLVTNEERVTTEVGLPEFKTRIHRNAENNNSFMITQQPKKAIEEESNESCQVCFENSQEAVIFNCGHGGLCFICALKLICSSGICHLCRHRVDMVLRLDCSFVNELYAKIMEGVDASNVRFYINLLKEVESSIKKTIRQNTIA